MIKTGEVYTWKCNNCGEEESVIENPHTTPLSIPEGWYVVMFCSECFYKPITWTRTTGLDVDVDKVYTDEIQV